MKRCSKCILPESVPNINFDAQGKCNFCHSSETSFEKFIQGFEVRREKFVRLLEEKKKNCINKGLKYDVLVPLSGGRDSSYIAWSLATQFNMKVLCVNYANPYTSQQAIRNIQTVVSAINADLVSFPDKGRMHERSFAKNMRVWLKKPDLATLSLICLACKPMYLEFYKIAHAHHIELIVDGSNIFEVTTFKMEAQGGAGAQKLLSVGPFINLIKRISRNIGYFHWCNVVPGIKTLLSLNGHTPYLRKRYPRITKMGYFYVFTYNENEINTILKSINWKKAEDNASPWRFDCEIDSLKNYVYQKLVGATEKDDLFSKYIRAHMLSRQEALERLSEGEVNPEVLEKVLNRIGLQKKDLDSAFEKKLNA